jgi:hypothetical protein
MYGLHSLVPIEYIILVVGGNERNSIPMKNLTSRIIEFEKLQKARMQATKIARI